MTTDADELIRMLRELQESSAIGAETVTDIEGYIEDAREDRLDSADLAYVRALHGRLTGTSASTGISDDESDDEDFDDDDFYDDGIDWQARAEEAERQLAEETTEDPRFDEIRLIITERFGH